MKKRNLFIMKFILIIMAVFAMAAVTVACSSATDTDKNNNIKETDIKISESPVVTDSEDYEEDEEKNTEGESEAVQPVETIIPTDVPADSAEVPEATVIETETATSLPTPTQTVPSVTTTAPAPTPITSEARDEINKDLAASFFQGEWESDSGMLYIFDSREGTVILKEKDTGNILLTGTYEASTDDYSEYVLSLTFNGETDSYIAWKYSDTGAVLLVAEETGETYDLLWRAAD